MEGPADLSPFAPALRPEFAADLAGMAEATHYHLDLHILPEQETFRISGREVVRYTNQEGVSLDRLYFFLYPNFPGCRGWVNVEAVLQGKRSLVQAYETQRAVLRLPLDPPLQPGERVTLDLSFEAMVPPGDDCRYGDFGYHDGVLALAHLYPQVAVYDERGWNTELPPNYGDLLYADTALYSVTATLPAGWVAAASGTQITREPRDDNTVRMHWVAGPARDFTMVLSQDYLTVTQEVGGIRVTSYYHSAHEAGGTRALEYAVRALHVFQERFGPYRYREFDLVETPTRAGGIEYPGLIVLNTWFYDQEDGGFETVTAHEVAHQWWYSLLGNDQVDEPWLDEGLASYSAVLYYQETEQEEAGEELLEFYRSNYQAAVDQGKDAPTNLPVAAYSPENYSRIVYSKGALFFDALRQEVGEEAFWRILQAYYQRFLYGTATGEGFLALAEEVSGQELDALYQAWVLGVVQK